MQDGSKERDEGIKLYTFAKPSKEINEQIVLWIHTFIGVFIGSLLSFYQFKNHKWSQVHTRPLKG